jgi:hypothetical protein
MQTSDKDFKNIFKEGELDPAATIKNSLLVRLEGNRTVNRNII